MVFSVLHKSSFINEFYLLSVIIISLKCFFLILVEIDFDQANYGLKNVKKLQILGSDSGTLIHLTLKRNVSVVENNQSAPGGVS